MIDEEEGNPKTEHSIGAYVVTSGNRVEITEYDVIKEEEESDPKIEDLRTKMVLSADVVSAANAAALGKKKTEKMIEKIRQIISGE